MNQQIRLIAVAALAMAVLAHPAMAQRGQAPGAPPPSGPAGITWNDSSPRNADGAGTDTCGTVCSGVADGNYCGGNGLSGDPGTLFTEGPVGLLLNAFLAVVATSSMHFFPAARSPAIKKKPWIAFE